MAWVRTTFLALALCTVSVAAQDEGEDGGGFLENLIEDRLSGPGFEVQVRGFEGALSSRATVELITISDDEGVWLTVRDAVLDWNRSALLRGRLSVAELAAAEVLLPRLPQPDNSMNVPQPEAQPFSLPELPVSVQIDAFDIDRLELGQPVIGEEAVVTLSGSAELAGGAGEADFRAERIDDEMGILALEGSYDNESRQLAIDLSLEEGPDGIVASLIELPGRPALTASVEGEGPLSDFTAAIALATAGEPRLEGTVTVQETDGANRFTVDLGGDVTALFKPSYRPFFGPDVQIEARGARFPDGRIDVDMLNIAAQSLRLTGEVEIGADGVPDLIDVTGEISAREGPVLLPVGQDIRVGRAVLDVQFDASEGERWTGDIIVENFAQPGVQIDRLSLDGEGIISGGETLEVTSALDFGAEGLALDSSGVGDALGDALTGHAEIGYRAGGPILLDRLTLDGAGFDLAGEGQIDPDGENIPVALDAQLDAADLTVFSPLVGRPIAGALSADLDLQATLRDGGFNVTLSGRGEDLATGMAELDPLLTGETLLELAAVRDATGLSVDRLALDNATVDLSATADISSETGTAQLDLTIDDLARIEPGLSGPAVLSVTAEKPEDVWSIVASATGAEAEMQADVDLRELETTTPLVDGEISIAAAELSNFSVFAGRELAGSADVDLTGQFRTDFSTATAEVSGRLDGVEVGEAEVDRLMRGTTEIAATISKDGAAIQVPTLRIENPQLTATGKAYVKPQDSELAADVTIRDLSEIVPEMSGTAELSLTASEDERGWTLDLTGTGAGAEIELDGTVTGLGGDAAPLATGKLSLSAPDLEVFSGLAKRDLGGAVSLDAEGQARLDFSEAEGRVTGTTRDLEVGQPELDRLLAGQTTLAAEGRKSGEAFRVARLSLENPQVALTGEGQYGTGDDVIQANIRFPELEEIVPEMSGPGTLSLAAEEVEDTWQVVFEAEGAGVVADADLEVSDLENEATPIASGQIALRAEDLSRFQRVVNRPIDGSVNLDASGSGAFDGSRFEVSVEVLANGLRIGIENVDQLLLGETTLSAEASRENGDAPIRVETFALDASGLDATASGSILGGSSDLTFEARLANLGIFVPELDGPVTAQGRAGQAEDGFALDIDLTGPQNITADVSGTVSESFDRADLSIDGAAPLRLANPFIQPRALTGDARFDLELVGPLELSSLSGQVTVSNGRFIDPALPMVLENLQATGRLQGGRIDLTASAAKQEGGRLQASGVISLQPGYAADLAIQLSDLLFEDQRIYRTTLDGEITVDGPLTGGAQIGGRLLVGETELRIPSTGLGVTGPIPEGLVHVNEPAEVRATRRRAGLIEEDRDGSGGGGGGVAYPLDIELIAENRIFIRGRGLDAELGGRLRIRGTTANVIPSGQFELIRGRLDILGQRLTLDEGFVNLQGDFSPVIRLVARTTTDDITVLIIVQGEATSPEIVFESEPELPEDEVLSRLLFGRSIENISPLQAAQLASAVATLAGRGGDGVIANLRQKTGLDDLDVTTDEEGDVGLRAGKYISDNAYTDVTVDAEGEAEINLNLDLTDTITVRGGAGNGGETNLGIFYERDY